jgi:hypothetical protein
MLRQATRFHHHWRGQSEERFAEQRDRTRSTRPHFHATRDGKTLLATNYLFTINPSLSCFYVHVSRVVTVNSAECFAANVAKGRHKLVDFFRQLTLRILALFMQRFKLWHELVVHATVRELPGSLLRVALLNVWREDHLPLAELACVLCKELDQLQQSKVDEAQPMMQDVLSIGQFLELIIFIGDGPCSTVHSMMECAPPPRETS